MQIGLITDSVGHLSFDETLDLAQRLQLNSVEVATGNWSEAPHIDLERVVSSDAARDEFAGKVADHGLKISALNANGNQLHPVTGPQHDKVLRDTIDLASSLGVPTVVCMSGLPAARNDSVPNWITSSWPPENVEVVAYQWDEVAIPYWKQLAAFASSTMLRLIESAGEDVVGANLDPSHLMGMGADIPTVIRTLGESIFHVHAKDTRLNTVITARDGLLTTHPMEKANLRAWNYVTLGLGHRAGETFWADFVYTLRSVGYDGTMNIEHEDVLVNSVEGVTRAAEMLKRVALVESPDWKPADV
jgi:sugar phosphate isomerase/epimerase